MMTEQQKDSSKSLVALGLLTIVLVLGGWTIGELINVIGGANKDLGISAETIDQMRSDEQTIQQSLNEYQKTADQLAQRNSFVPPGSTEPPGDCSVIFGDEALFGNQWVKTGDMLGDADVLEVGAATVTLLWEGRIITRSAVGVASDTKKSPEKKSSEYDMAVIEKKMTAELSKAAAAKLGIEVKETVYDAKGNLAEHVYGDGTRILFDAAGNMTEKITTDGTVYNIQEKTTTTQGATSGRIR